MEMGNKKRERKIVYNDYVELEVDEELTEIVVMVGLSREESEESESISFRKENKKKRVEIEECVE